MNIDNEGTASDIRERLHKEPDIFLLLAQNSISVARSLRQLYLEVSIEIAERIRASLFDDGDKEDDKLTIRKIDPSIALPHLTACFIDGGVGEAEIFFRVPLIVRGGIFRVKEGERDLEHRETFEFFPVLIGDLEGGEKSRSDYASVVRIIVELAAIWHVLQGSKYSDINLIMLHGPLLYRLSAYTDHWFYESDIKHMTEDAETLIQGYKEFCKEDPVSRDWFPIWAQERKVRANHMIAYLLKSIIQRCAEREIYFVGAVERGAATEICKQLLKKMLEDDASIDPLLLPNPSGQYVRDAEEIINRGNYNDPLLFSLALEPGEYLSPPWEAKERYTGFVGPLEGFGEWLKTIVPIAYTYLKPVENALALRVEFPLDMGKQDDVMQLVMTKVYQYARLLPNYAFPIGLDVVDKFAKVPKWMVEAYRKYIMFNFGRLAQEGTFDQTELERMLLFYHLHQRSFFNRPKAK